MPELTSSKDVSWSKVIWSVLIIVVVGGLISGALFWYFVARQPTESTPVTTKVATFSSKKATSSVKPDETAGWKIHQTETFSIRAPDGWVVPPNDEIPGESINIQKIIDQNNYFDIQVMVQTVGGISPATENYETWNEVIVEFNSQKVKANEITFEDGHWLMFPQTSGSAGEYFQLFSRQKPSNDDRDLMLKILSTFKFL